MTLAYPRVVLAVARKDLLLEARTKRSLASAVVFASLVVVVFAFVFGQALDSPAVVATGGLWLALVFAGTVGMTRAIAVEGERSALDGLLLAPVDRSAVYLGKVLSTCAFVTTVGLLSLAFVTVFLDYGFGVATLARLAVVLPLAALGFCAVGVLLSVVLLESPLQGSLLPVLLVPLVIPVVLAGIELTAPRPGTDTTTWFQLLLIYDALMVLTGWVTFDYAVER